MVRKIKRSTPKPKGKKSKARLVDPATLKTITLLDGPLPPDKCFAVREDQRIEVTFILDKSKPKIMTLIKANPNLKCNLVLRGNTFWSPHEINGDTKTLTNALFSFAPLLSYVDRFEVHLALNLVQEGGEYKMVHAPFTTGQIREDTDKLIVKYKDKFEGGDDEALFELLELCPAFVDLPFVSRAVNTWMKNRDWKKLERAGGKRGKGQPEKEVKWSYFFMVEALRKENPDYSIQDACIKLAEMTFITEEPEAETIREYYFNCKKRLHERAIIMVYQPAIRECALMPSISPH